MRYIKELDGIRFIAIAFVLLQHFAIPIGERISAGYFGVELFFVLSGFLITRIIYDSSGSTLGYYKKFIGRRALRIFPIYYLIIGLLLLAGEPSAKAYLLPLATYTFNYTIAEHSLRGIPFIHFWSLCVEEQFYIIWPFIILLLRNRFRLLLATLAFIIVAGWAQMLFHFIPMPKSYDHFGLFPRAYALSLGGLTALLCRQYPAAPKWMQHQWIELASLMVLIISLVIAHPLMYVITPSVSALFLAKIYYSELQWPALQQLLQKKWAIYLGRISYGIYLYHIPVSVYFTRYIFNPYIWNKINFKALGPLAGIQHHAWPLKFVLFTALSIGVAHLSFQYIEKPLLRLKDKWFA
ncbi:MAG TPA: acyltransferase [Phnomibacter sp.]|nr:acyltransferase [Phnomibacter sp.]